MRRQNLLPGCLLLAVGLLLPTGRADAGPQVLSPADLQGVGLRAGNAAQAPATFVPSLVPSRIVAPIPQPWATRPVPQPRPTRLVPQPRPAMAESRPLTLGEDRLQAVALKPAPAAKPASAAASSPPAASPLPAASPPPAEQRAATEPVTAVSAAATPPAAAAVLPVQLDPDALIAVGLGVRGRAGGEAP